VESDSGNRAVRSGRFRAFVLASGAALLAFDPILWLVQTWVSPTYRSAGVYVFAIVVGLFLWSASSELAGPPIVGRRRAVRLLVASGAVRLASRVLAVNVLGALTLVVDLYAIGLLLALDRRRRSVSPAWLAAAFLFSLPVERIVQRLLGFPLQQISAAGACHLLRAGVEDVRCEGVRLMLNGSDVLVDLPCSGARGLLQLLLLFACLGAVIRPNPRAAFFGLTTVLAAGLASNALRISLLAVGIGYRSRLGAIDVMSDPWHGLIGLLSMALAAASLVVWYRRCEGCSMAAHSVSGPRIEPPSKLSLAKSVAFLASCAAVVSVPSRPVDVSAPAPPPALPLYLDGEAARPEPLSEKEQEYFTLFGGGAARARYGESALMLVSTSSPLRHLHAPDECLAGSGLDVSFQGVDRRAMPSAVYRAVAPDGVSYRVAVTYVSATGDMVPSVAEVVWRWLQTPATWSAVHRVTPWEESSESPYRFDDAVARALDLAPAGKETP
jgi:exosortase/archaeosortase family protein